MNDVIISRINDLAAEHKAYSERYIEIDFMSDRNIGDYKEFDFGFISGYLRRIENELYFLFSILTSEEMLQFSSLEESFIFNIEGTKFDIKDLEPSI